MRRCDIKKNIQGKRRGSDEVELKNLARALAGSKSAAEILGFLNGILTPPEREKITLRWQLVKLLDHGMSQRAIAKMLGISLCKITRGSKELKQGPSGFRKIMARGLAMERKV